MHGININILQKFINICPKLWAVIEFIVMYSNWIECDRLRRRIIEDHVFSHRCRMHTFHVSDIRQANCTRLPANWIDCNYRVGQRGTRNVDTLRRSSDWSTLRWSRSEKLSIMTYVQRRLGMPPFSFRIVHVKTRATRNPTVPPPPLDYYFRIKPELNVKRFADYVLPLIWSGRGRRNTIVHITRRLRHKRR